MNCLYCTSNSVNKNWKLPSWWQRRRCFDCSKQFSVGWKRWTYSKEFKDTIMKEYCHSPKTAREVIHDYHISSTTLVKRKKEHKKDCDICSNEGE